VGIGEMERRRLGDGVFFPLVLAGELL